MNNSLNSSTDVTRLAVVTPWGDNEILWPAGDLPCTLRPYIMRASRSKVAAEIARLSALSFVEMAKFAPSTTCVIYHGCRDGDRTV